MFEACVQVCQRWHQVQEKACAIGHGLSDGIIVKIALGDKNAARFKKLGSSRIGGARNGMYFDIGFEEMVDQSTALGTSGAADEDGRRRHLKFGNKV